MAEEKERIAVGFSGGADSLALLLLLHEYGRTHGIEVSAVHVNHGIRGAEAMRDQSFCKRTCEALGVPITVVRKDVPALAGEWGVGLEEAGRSARYECFEELLRSGKADKVALAHHQNDQAETMLFHLMRGSGLRGLRGMKPVRGRYIRPLLCAGRGEIEEWLADRGALWMEDTTNGEEDYTRNQIRRRLLSSMEEIRPGSVRNMAKSAERLLELEDYLDQQLGEMLGETASFPDGCCEIALEKLEALHPYMQKELLLCCLERIYGGRQRVQEAHVAALLALAGSGRGSRCALPDGYEGVLGYEYLRIAPRKREKKEEGEYLCPVNGTCRYRGRTFSFVLEEWKKNEEIPSNRYTKWFDYDKIKKNVSLRTRRPGDYLEVAPGAHRKLKDYLIDEKVPRDMRDGLTVLADGRSVIWVVGMRISEAYKITDETKRILKVQMTEDGGI